MKKLLAKVKKFAVSKRAAVMSAVMALTALACAVGVHAEGEPTGSAAISSA